MVKKLICIFTLIVAITFHVKAVDLAFGFEGGYSYNMLNTSTGYRAFTSYENRGGFLLGIPLLISFTEHLALGSGLRYIQKNYRYERDFQDDRLFLYSDYTNGFLQIPLYANISLANNNLRLFFDLGLTLGIWLHSNRKGQWLGVPTNVFDLNYLSIHEFNERVDFDSTRDNRFDSALFAGIGFKYTMRHFSPFISAQFHYGLTNLQKDYMLSQVARYNNAITVQMGFLFNSALFARSR
jgi:hypothetical protein